MKFFASVADKTHSDRVVASLVIEAPTWHDANQYCAKALGRVVSDLEGRVTDVTKPGKASLLVTQTGNDAGADVEIRWIGSDAGSAQGRQREVRVRSGEKWSEWKRDA